LNLLVKQSVVGFENKDVIALRFDNRARHLFLAIRGVSGHHSALQVKQL